MTTGVLLDLVDRVLNVVPRVLRPARPDHPRLLARAVEAALAEEWGGQARGRTRMARVTSPSVAVAWETLAADGAIPPEWVASTERRFANATTRDRDAATVGALWDAPPDVRACAAFAADVRGVLAAEALAREVAARLAAWTPGAFGATDVVWSFTAPRSTVMLAPFAAFGALETALAATARDPALAAALRDWTRALEEALGALRGPRPPARLNLELLLWLLVRWEIARDAACAVPAGAVCAGRAYASLPDPFAPLLELLGEGYLLDGLGPARVELVAPLERLV